MMQVSSFVCTRRAPVVDTTAACSAACSRGGDTGSGGRVITSVHRRWNDPCSCSSNGGGARASKQQQRQRQQRLGGGGGGDGGGGRGATLRRHAKAGEGGVPSAGAAAVSLATERLPTERRKQLRTRGASSNERGAGKRRDAGEKADLGASPSRSAAGIEVDHDYDDDYDDDGVFETSAGGEHGPKVVAFTGGTAFNGIVNELMDLTSRVTHVLPVSDDGGSTAEIIRVLGGPAVGDVRSRCLRLSDESTAEARAVKELLAHRLHATDSAAAKAEWYCIQEGDHDLWNGISEPYADIIRSFLLYFHSQITAAKTPVKFDFVNGSVGNFFFAGARMFFRSMEAAILLYSGPSHSRVSRIPAESVVVPNIVLDDNVRVALGAELENGETIRGQNEISHPSPDPKTFTKGGGGGGGGKAGGVKALAASSEFWKQMLKSGEVPEVSASEFWGGLQKSSGGHERVRDAFLDGNLWSAGELIQSRLYDLTVRPLSVWDMDKVISGYDDLKSPIRRVFYLSTEDPTSVSAVYPEVNPTILRQLGECDGVIYGMGSLYTSIVPSLILQGVGEAIAARNGPKVLILNGGLDRETGAMTASGVVMAVVNALNRAKDPDESRRCTFAVSDYITTVIAPEGGGIPLDVDELLRVGVRRVVEVGAKPNERGAEYDTTALIDELRFCLTGDADADAEETEVV